jgi:ankyrin repeat protein
MALCGVDTKSSKFTLVIEMDFDEAFAAGIRAGSISDLTSLGIGPDTVNDVLLCDTPISPFPNQAIRIIRRPTPLIYAILCRQLPIVEYLVKLGANVTTPLYDGWNALHYAAATFSAPIIDFLITRFPDQHDALTTNRATPLHVAVAGNDVDSAIILLQNGADVSIANAIGNTALHMAAGLDDTFLLELLISFGAERGAKNAKGDTPEAIARRAKKKKTVDVLRGKKIVRRREVLVSRKVQSLGVAGELEEIDQRLSVVEELVAGLNK